MWIGNIHKISKMHFFWELLYLERKKSWKYIGRLYTPLYKLTNTRKILPVYTHAYTRYPNACEFTSLLHRGPYEDQNVWYHLFWCATLKMESWVFSTSNVEQISSLRYTFLLPFLFFSWYISYHAEIRVVQWLTNVSKNENKNCVYQFFYMI